MGRIGAKLYGALALVLTFLAAILRFRQVKEQRDKARQRAANAEAQIGEANKVNEAESELDQEFSDLERESKNAQKDGEIPAHIRDRNDF